ncbi:hypothetical protein [Bremerella cremea]|uniref:hypothetical protein n=1 Tax=Bremerella cremea TaxID=1031537 RepID=UPI0031EE4CEC
MDLEDLANRGFIITPDMRENNSIGRAQSCDLHFEADQGARVTVLGFRAGAHAEGKLEKLRLQTGIYPQDIRTLHVGAGIN